MGAPQKKEDPPPAGAPLYMVSFGDMMTIMLTFFILLCSYATERQAGFVSDGIGSFRNNLNALGLPGILPSDKNPVDLGASHVRYQPAEAVNARLLTDATGRITDLNRDALRSVVKDALRRDDVTRVPMEFIYEPGEIEPSRHHREALDIVAPIINGKNLKVRIEAYAYEEGESAKDTRRIAAARAIDLARYLEEAHGVRAERLSTVGYGSGGAGGDNRVNRVVQDRLGRRIALVYLVPAEN